MTIKRYFATADNTISNAFDQSLLTTNRATGSNMGEADILEVFQIYAQSSSSSGLSSELSRVLVQFDTSAISTDRSSGAIPASGSVSFFLKLYNARHASTLPENYSMTISAVSQSWQEGNGLDMVNYTDKTYDLTGSNWVRRGSMGEWNVTGGTYHASPTYTATFNEGYEDLEVDVTTLVEQWVNSEGNVLGSKDNYGFGIRLSDSFESALKSFYTKKFFARGSEFYYKRPVLEARWDGSVKDDRSYFFASSSLAPAADNLNTLYLYNSIRGVLRNIPAVGTSDIEVSLYDSAGGSQIGSTFTGSHVSTGIYKCQVFADTAETSIVDVWHSGGVEYHTGSITVNPFSTNIYNPSDRYILNISNLKEYYGPNETARFKLYVRPRNWSPNIYTVAKSAPQTTTISSASYEICRAYDNYPVIPFGTGSTNHTMLSYNVSGNYFDLDMSIFETDQMYTIKFAFYDDGVGSWNEQSYKFNFKVRSDVY
tara:strand:+ start:18 stop:1466 length:1449 start_codon:yes stop_codon:yes gene_type:complete